MLLACVIWLLGTNYQNNLILALAYMQISMFVIIILNTYNNLSGVEVKINGAKNVCLGESVLFSLSVLSPNRIGTHYVTVGWRRARKGAVANKLNLMHLYDFESNKAQPISVPVSVFTRGYHQPKFLLLESTFPMGLVRCWTWLYFDAKALVYPMPVACSFPVGHSVHDDEGDEGGAQVIAGGDDFIGFSPYRPGDSSRHIAWRLFAREQGLYCKQYGSTPSKDTWLVWSDFHRGDVEVSLSNMCFWAIELNKQQQYFGIRLPSQEVSIGEGEAHLHEVLTALALYEGAT